MAAQVKGIKVKTLRHCTVAALIEHLTLIGQDSEVCIMHGDGELVGVTQVLVFEENDQVWIVADEQNEGWLPQPDEEAPSCELEGDTCAVSFKKMVEKEEKKEEVRPDVCAGSRAKEA